jgi:hypothetical protein
MRPPVETLGTRPVNHWGALLIAGLFCVPGVALADARAPEPPDLIGQLLDDPIGFLLDTHARAPAPPEALEGVEGIVTVGLERPREQVGQHAELAARAFDINYTFAYPDSVRRAGADR